jgi:hypothetical protein
MIGPDPTHQRNGHFRLTRGLARNMRTVGLSGNRWKLQYVAPRALAHTRNLVLLCGLASCTGSRKTLALAPDFEVITPTGIASVSILASPTGMTAAEFTRVVMAGMEQAARGSVIAGPVRPPFPVQRIVWHVNSPERGISRLVVNVFDGLNPYAYEQDTVTGDSPAAVVTSVQSMCKRLLVDVAAEANKPRQIGEKWSG